MVDESTTKKYPGKQYNIPFYDAQRGEHFIKLKIKKERFDSRAAGVTRPGDFTTTDKSYIKNVATNRFITHYFPEFYAFLYDSTAFSLIINSNAEVAGDLKSDIKGKIVIGRVDPLPNPAKLSIVVALVYDVDKKREGIKSAHCLPSYEESLAFFNTHQKISGTDASSTFAIGTIGKTNSTLNDGLKAFNTQMRGMEGQLSLTPDMSMLAATTQSAISLAVTLLTKQLKATTPTYKFSQADTMTVYFGSMEAPGVPGGKQIAISRIDYLLVEESIASRPMRIGYMSNIKFNNTVRDPLTLITLKNYQTILDAISAPGQQSAGSATSGFMEFMRNPEVQGVLGLPATNFGVAGTVFDPSSALSPPGEPGNAFINAAKQMMNIDIENTDDLEKGFKTAFSSKQLQALKLKIADNPEVFKKVSVDEAKKNLGNAIDTVKIINNVLETGPMGFIEKNPIVSNIFKMFGIKEIAKEAVICLTMGLNVELGRIGKAVQASLTKAQASLYLPPPLTRPGGDIRKPYINPDDFKMFTISGDIWKQVLDTVIDSLQQSVLDIIKKLADLLKYNCPLNNPRATDYGATDIADLIAPDLQTPDLLGAGSALDQLAGQRALTAEELQAYLTAVSGILSSMEICQLFTNRAAIGPDTLDKIMEFNKEYPNQHFQNKVITYSTILAFFNEMSMMVDVTDLCNAIANEVYFANQDNIEICLTPGNAPTVEMEELLDLMENGIELKMPVLNFDCPDKENFINDPTITITVPELFNTLTQLIETQFVNSAEAVKTLMLEQKFTTDSDGSILDALRALGNNYEDNGWPPKLDPAFVAKIIEALDAVASFDLESCDVDVSQILGFDPAEIAGIGGDITSMVSDTMQDPGFISAIDNIKAQLMGLSTPSGDPANPGMPVFPSYRFNLQFYREFINYIELDRLGYVPGSLTIPWNFSSTVINDAQEFSGIIPPSTLTQIPITDGSYKPIEINFNFPTATPFLFSAPGATEAPDFPTAPSIPNAPSTTHAHPVGSSTEETVHPNANPDNGLTPGDPGYVDEHNAYGDTSYPGDHVHPNSPLLETSIPVAAAEPSTDNTTDWAAGTPALAMSEVGGPINIPEIHWSDDRVIGRILYYLTLSIAPPSDPESMADLSTPWPLIGAEARAAWQADPTSSPTPDYPPTFQEEYPIIYNQIRYSASVLKLVPLSELTPTMLSAIQSYMNRDMTDHFAALIDYYEAEKNVRLVATEQEQLDSLLSLSFDDAYNDLLTARILIPDAILKATTANLQSHGSYLKIQYPRESPNNPNIFVEFESSGDYIPQQQLMEEITESMLEQEFETAANNIQNTYIQPFVDSFSSSTLSVDGALTPETKALIESKHFPTVYGILVDNMFNYVITNGVFDAATLQSLTLFHLNENCPPSEVADLLDVQGIMKQLKDEYVEAMCNDRPEIPSRTIIRNVIKYGMHLELIQMQIAQIFIKNIFVMTAFKLDSLLTDGEADAMNQSGFIFKFLRKQITTSLLTFLRNSENMDESTVRRDLVSYFNIKINRESNVAQGGIKYSNGTIAFPTGVTFSVTDSGAFVGFDEIIDYLISERLYLGRESVAKAIRMSVPGNNPVSLDQAFLASIPTFTVTNEYPGVLVQKIQEYYGTDDTPRVFLTRKYYQLTKKVKRATIKMWYYYGGGDGVDPDVVNIFEFSGMLPSFGSGGTEQTMLEKVRAGIIPTDTQEAPFGGL